MLDIIFFTTMSLFTLGSFGFILWFAYSMIKIETSSRKQVHMKHKINRSNFAKRINPHKPLRSVWVNHVNEQKQYEPIIYDCGIFNIMKLSASKHDTHKQINEVNKMFDSFKELL